jgi:hypothetical protein
MVRSDQRDGDTRMSRYGQVIASCILMLVAAFARAEPQVSIVAIDPADGAALAVNQSLYVRIAYRTDEPSRLWARPFFQGRQIEQAMTNASEQFTGSGEALGWFALIEPANVDEIRIIAGGGEPYRERVVASQPVQFRWGDAASSAAAGSPQWVGDLTSAADARERERAAQRASEPVRASDAALFSGFMLTILAVAVAGIGLPIWSLRKWRNGWRIAAALPLIAVAFVVLRIIVDTARDPTSHNLWPFEIVMVSALSLVTIAVLKVLRRFMGADDASTP